MRISRLKIVNIKGIGSPGIEFKPRTLTLICGDNGTGKTSIKDAILAVFQGGCDPSWLHGWPDAPAQRGVIEMDIVDDGGQIVAKISKTVRMKRDGSGVVSDSAEVIDSNGVPVPAPMTFIEKLGQSWAVDPSAILKIDASKSEGRKILMRRMLEIMPVTFAPEELSSALDELEVPILRTTSPSNLADFDKVRSYVEMMRQRVGVEARDAEGAYHDIRRSMPAEEDMAQDWAARETELRAQDSSLQTEAASAKRAAQELADAERGVLRKAAVEKEQAARLVLHQALLDIAKELSDGLADVQMREQAAWVEITRGMEPKMRELASELATISEKVKQRERARGAEESAARVQSRWKEKGDKYDALTLTLGKLDALKKTKLEGLPVAGVSFGAGDTTFIDSVEWQHVNTAKKYQTCMQLSALLAGDLPFQVWDDVEHFTPENRQSVLMAAAEGGFQVIAAVAEAGELRIVSL